MNLEDDNSVKRLSIQSMNDRLYQESKALSGGIPFSGSGYAGGAPIYSSMEAWDRTIDNSYGWGPNSVAKYASKVGDLSHSSLIMAAVRFLGNVLPEAPLQVKKNEDKEGEAGQKGESVVVPDHPMVKLWNRPNQYYSGSTLRKALAFSWVLKSEAFIIKNFNVKGTLPVELWYEPHWTIRPRFPTDGSEFISYYEVNRNGRWYQVPVENVIHFRDGLNPYDQRSGLSGIPAILRELFGDNEAADYYANLMGGSAIPPFLVSIDKDMEMKQEDIDEFSAMLKRKTTGDRRGEPIAAKGARAYKLAFTPRELDLRETRYMPEDRFCAVMGIPAVVLELGSGQAHSIYNNVQQAMERAWNSYVKPLLRHFEEELNVQLLEDFEGEESNCYCEHDLSKVQALQEDEDAKAKRLSVLYDAGGIMLSELRSGMKYGPSDPTNPDADKVFKVMLGATLRKPGEEPEPPTEPGLPGEGEEELPIVNEEPIPGETPQQTEERVAKEKAALAAAKEARANKPPKPGESQGEGAPPSFIFKTLKALKDGQDNLSNDDVQRTIQWLKKKRMKQAVAMMTAKPMDASSNGDKTGGSAGAV